MTSKYFASILLLLFFLVSGVQFADGTGHTIRTWPVDILLDRLVLLRADKNKSRKNLDNRSELTDQEFGVDLDLDLLDDPEGLVSLLQGELLDEAKLMYFLSWLDKADPLAKMHTNDLVVNIKKNLLAEKLHRHESYRIKTENSHQLIDQALLALNPIKISDSYQYAYGRELDRKIIKNFDAIHRQTFFENKLHKVDVGIDFLKPLKAILKTLKLEEKFEWIFENIVYIGYKSSFKHHKKVFMRFKGYYAKTSITFELMRRKRYWWGYGNWELAGTASKVVEEPMAVIGTDVKELEPSQN